MRKVLLVGGFVVVCLSCAWFGFWFGFSEMFFEHVHRQYYSDVAELLADRHWVRCLDEDSPKAIGDLRNYLKVRREALTLTRPQPVSWTDRLQLVADPRVLWMRMQQHGDVVAGEARMAALVEDESRPATCSGAKASEKEEVH
jgi:hypothetical protein